MNVSKYLPRSRPDKCVLAMSRSLAAPATELPKVGTA